MKKLGLVLFLFAFAFGLECFGQFNPNKQIIYGTPRSDGYNFVKKGALWASHPEAKIIYEGGHVEGFSELVLKADAFVRFIDTEHNSKDNNYILFPKGEVIYWDSKTGQPRSAKCGNAIEFAGYVADIIVKPLDEKPASRSVDDSASSDIDYTRSIITKSSDDIPVNSTATTTTTKETKEHTKFGKWHRKNWWWADPLVAGAIGYGTYELLRDHGSAATDDWRNQPFKGIGQIPTKGLTIAFHL